MAAAPRAGRLPRPGGRPLRDRQPAYKKKEALENGDLRLYLRREGRGGLRGELVVQMDTRTLAFRALSEEEVKEAKEDGGATDPQPARPYRHAAVMRLLAQGHSSAPALAEELSMSERGVRYVLQELIAKGLVRDTGERVGPTRRSVVYALTEQGNSETESGTTTPGDEPRVSYSDYPEDEDDVDPFADACPSADP